MPTPAELNEIHREFWAKQPSIETQLDTARAEALRLFNALKANDMQGGGLTALMLAEFMRQDAAKIQGNTRAQSRARRGSKAGKASGAARADKASSKGAEARALAARKLSAKEIAAQFGWPLSTVYRCLKLP